MSNICSNYVTVNGDSASITALKQQIHDIHQFTRRELTEDNWFLCDAEKLCCDYGLTNLQKSSYTELTFNITSRNAPPLKNLSDLSAQHPTLTITCEYEEPGCLLYGKARYTGGSCVEDTNYTEEEWLEENDDDYSAEKERIAELSYEEFLEEYADWDVDEEPKYVYLGKDIIDRIKDEDLPLFVNVDWHDDEITAKYKARYS